MDRYAEAVDDDSIALSIVERDANVLCHRGWSFAAMRQWGRAEEDFTLALQVNPMLPRACTGRAWALVNQSSGLSADNPDDISLSVSLWKRAHTDLLEAKRLFGVLNQQPDMQHTRLWEVVSAQISQIAS